MRWFKAIAASDQRNTGSNIGGTEFVQPCFDSDPMSTTSYINT
jgi:hypothetical protein